MLVSVGSGKAQCERGPAFRVMLAGSPVPGDPASGVLLLTSNDGEGAGLVAKAASSRTLLRAQNCLYCFLMGFVLRAIDSRAHWSAVH